MLEPHLLNHPIVAIIIFFRVASGVEVMIVALKCLDKVLFSKVSGIWFLGACLFCIVTENIYCDSNNIWYLKCLFKASEACLFV